MAKNTEKERFIASTMKTLEISEKEALELWDFDHDEADNEEVDAIEAKTKKAKEAVKDKAPSKIGRVVTMKAKKKADEEKESIIAKIFAFVKSEMTEAKIMTATKITFKDSMGSFYTVAVTKHKSKPTGYDLDEKIFTVEDESEVPT